MSVKLLATLQPNFPHFTRFSHDKRLSGLRLNNPHWTPAELGKELELAKEMVPSVPLYFDVKGWQLRVTEVHPSDEYLDISLNHPISVETPTVVIFKAGADHALLKEISEGGTRLMFEKGPKYLVKPGESLQIRCPSLKVLGEQFSPQEVEKIAVARRAGVSRYFLSYVQSESDVDRFLEHVGHDAEVSLKIENQHGLSFVTHHFKKKENLQLVAARGDLYVEIDRPHRIAEALREIIAKDPEACVGSRIMLSVVHEPVPSCADFLELAWLYDVGYRSVLLCDELCLRENLLGLALNACSEFFDSCHAKEPVPRKVPVQTPAPRSFWQKLVGKA